MNEGEQSGRGLKGGTPSVLRHSLSPVATHPPLYSASRGVRGRREESPRGGGEVKGGKARNAHLLWPTPEPPQPPPPAAAAAAAKSPPGSPCTKGSAERVSPGPRHPPAPRPPASPELSVAQTSPAGPAGPAPPSPRAPRTLSNPLGSRRLLREETLAAAGAGAVRLRAGRRRRRRRRWGARYGEPSNEARAGAQRRRVLAEHGRGAAAATAAVVVVVVAAGAQGPLHHWQPWSPSIFLPRGRRSARHSSSGRKGPAPELVGGRRDVRGSGGCEPRVLFLGSRLVLTPLISRPGGRGAAGGGGSFLGGVGGQTGWCSDCSRRRSKEREVRAKSQIRSQRDNFTEKLLPLPNAAFP
uniref:Uncharacterized protein LOC109697733 n=1 Tax=Castor canadensis TaxID=51338 RepID=A0A8B7W479_CASCN|nr:uncharacterized protein LOC109697733 [Castor canadensis]